MRGETKQNKNNRKQVQEDIALIELRVKELMFKVVTREGAELYTIKQKPHQLQQENKKHALNVARQPHHLRSKDTNV